MSKKWLILSPHCHSRTHYTPIHFDRIATLFLFVMGDVLYTYGPWVQFILFIIMCTLMENKLVFRIKLLRSQLWVVNNLKASNIRDRLINIIIKSLRSITWVLSTILKCCLILNSFTLSHVWRCHEICYLNKLCTLIINTGVNFFNTS
jgi:hypothetical protein